MEIKVKPVTDTVNLSKTLTDILYDKLPINKWCKEQELKNKKVKL